MPSSAIRPHCSATGMNRTGEMNPRSGCRHRASASKPVMRRSSGFEPRLKPHLEFVIAQGTAQITLDQAALVLAAVHLGIEPDHQTAAARLGLIHRGVGMPDESRPRSFRQPDGTRGRGSRTGGTGFHRCRSVRSSRSTMASARASVASGCGPSRHRMANSSPPVRARNASVADKAMQAPADVAQQPVARLMTQRVVDHLEAIQIETQQPELRRHCGWRNKSASRSFSSARFARPVSMS